MTRKTYINLMGLVLGTTLVGLILVPLAFILLPAIMIYPKLGNSAWNRITEQFMKAGTQVMIKGIRR